MDEIVIKINFDRSVSIKNVEIGSMQESGVTTLVFEFDDELVALAENVYFFVHVKDETYPYILHDKKIIIGKDITQHRRVKANVVISTADYTTNTEKILGEKVWISDTFTLWCKMNHINEEAVSNVEGVVHLAVEEAEKRITQSTIDAYEEKILGGRW